MIKLKGWRGEPDIEKLKLSVWKSSLGESLWRRAAWVLLHGKDVDTIVNEDAKDSYKSWLKSRGHWIMREIVEADPGKYGLIKINPDEINKPMTRKELLAFCEVSKKKLSELIRGAPENGCPSHPRNLAEPLREDHTFSPLTLRGNMLRD